ncbi:hypothetical protein, partial [Lactococcus petauri]|uniref:hypothetical protein n=1 Tax=Lactococcus petauri TaxID=1940789 RepID=UPI0021F0BFA2
PALNPNGNFGIGQFNPEDRLHIYSEECQSSPDQSNGTFPASQIRLEYWKGMCNPIQGNGNGMNRLWDINGDLSEFTIS